jgi:hypothetical protein
MAQIKPQATAQATVRIRPYGFAQGDLTSASTQAASAGQPPTPARRLSATGGRFIWGAKRTSRTKRAPGTACTWLAGQCDPFRGTPANGVGFAQ